MACLQENVSVGMKKVEAKVFQSSADEAVKDIIINFPNALRKKIRKACGGGS